MDFDSDITCRGGKRIYSHFISTKEAFEQAIKDMREETTKSGEILYQELITSNPKNINKLLPSIEIIPLHTPYYGEIPISFQEQRQRAVKMLKNEIRGIEKYISSLIEYNNENNILIDDKVKKFETVKSRRIKELDYLYYLQKLN